MTCEDMAQALGTDAYAPESPAAYFRECEHAGACLRVAMRARVWGTRRCVCAALMLRASTLR